LRKHQEFPSAHLFRITVFLENAILLNGCMFYLSFVFRYSYKSVLPPISGMGKAAIASQRRGGSQGHTQKTYTMMKQAMVMQYINR
jgi:hypothetical protein